MRHQSKQTFIISAVCALAVAGAAWYVFGNGKGAPAARPSTENVQADAATVPTDSEWRNEFFGQSTSTMTTSPAKIGSTTQALTLTDRLGRDLFSKFVDLKQADLIGNADVVDQTADNLVTASYGQVKPKTYSQSDLILTAATGTAAFQAYGNAVVSVFNSYKASRNGSAIMQDYLTNSDPSILSQLDPAIAEQKAMIAELLAIPVPLAFAGYDIDAVNAMSSLEAGTEAMRSTGADTVKGMVGIGMHTSAAQSLVDALDAIAIKLRDNGLGFGLDWSVMNPLLN
ncbi:MAG: hypothetical protein KGI69_00035 [Patescibacteria group bacterium]|nr:hypothetical protein [Patescibacteria group bacterium]